MLKILLILLIFFGCSSKESQIKESKKDDLETIQPIEIEKDKVFITEDIIEVSNKLNLIFIPFNDKSDKKKFPSSKTISFIIENSILSILKMVPAFDVKENISSFIEKKGISSYDIATNYNADIIIYGDIKLETEKGKPVANVNLKMWTKATEKIEIKKYRTKTDINIFDSIDEMLSFIIKYTLNEEFKIAYLNFKNFKINNGSYQLYISDKLVANITNSDFDLNLKILANSLYNIKIKNMSTKKIVKQINLSLKPGETTNITHTATGSIICFITNRLPLDDHKIFLNKREIKLDTLISNVSAERSYILTITNLRNNNSYTTNFYMPDGENITFYLPSYKATLTDIEEPKTYAYYDGYSSLKVYQTNDLDGKKAIIGEFMVGNPGWAVLTLNFKPELLNWQEMNILKIWMYGRKTYKHVYLQLVDKFNEKFTVRILDSWMGWRELYIPIIKFRSRADFQSGNYKLNFKIDYPLKSINFLLDSYYNSGSTGRFRLIIGDITILRE